jgi:hypothetical protein
MKCAGHISQYCQKKDPRNASNLRLLPLVPSLPKLLRNDSQSVITVTYDGNGKWYDTILSWNCCHSAPYHS